MAVKYSHCKLLPFARPARIASIDLERASQRTHMERLDRAMILYSLYIVIDLSWAFCSISTSIQIMVNILFCLIVFVDCWPFGCISGYF